MHRGVDPVFIYETRPRNKAGNELGCMGFSPVAAKLTSCHLASFSRAGPAQLSGEIETELQT